MERSDNYYVTNFYKFFPVRDVEALKIQLDQKADELDLLGLIILAGEGFNGTLSSPSSQAIESYEDFLKQICSDPQLIFKRSTCTRPPFRRFKTKIRDEIVTLNTPELFPSEGRHRHLSPEEWNKVLKEEKDFLLIDTRNWYETKLGTFRGALDPNIEQFTDFPEYLEKNNVPKDKKLLIFCTGGIRCEKGILEMEKNGYENVYQLEGGILNYLKVFPHDQFEGECFVFDHRVALDQELKPSKKYGLCPHDGQPADVAITCVRCDTETLISRETQAQEDESSITCSKNCAYHWKLKPGVKGPRQEQEFVAKRSSKASS